MYNLALSAGPSTAERGLERSRLCDVNSAIDWLATARRLPQRVTIPHLLTQLELLAELDLDPAVHFQVMRLLRRPILRAAAALQRPNPCLPDGGLGPVTEATIEQRLDHLAQVNLKRLFENLDRHRYDSSVSTEENRGWVLRQLVKFLRRQVRYAMLARRPCLPGTWQDAHDLFVYLVIRGHVQLDSVMSVDAPEQHSDIDAYFEYNRLLLMGRAAQLDLSSDAMRELMCNLERWARGSRLVEPEGHRGEYGLLLVEVSYDRPIRLESVPLQSGFRGWVLLPAQGFKDFCAESLSTSISGGRLLAAG